MTDLSAFGHWLSGFSDGEACFHLKGYARKDSPMLKFACAFQIGLRADDLSILQQIQRYFGCGTIRPFRTKSTHPLNFKSKPRFYYCIDSVAANLGKVVPHFDRYPLRSKKANDYAVWREAVLFLSEVGARPRNISVPGGARRWSESDEQSFLDLKRRLEDGRSWKGPEKGAWLIHTYKLSATETESKS